MTLSADGYVAGSDGSFDWAAPSEELHRFHNERVAAVDVQLLGRRLYETMLVWDTEEFADPVMAEFAAIWRPLEKIVFSTTLTGVEGSNRLATGALEKEIAALGDRKIAVGGAGANGFQSVEVASPETVTTAADGRAAITFTTPGWHRIKATDFATGVESVIRSNRLDVCVPAPPASGCGALPSDAQVRTPPPAPPPTPTTPPARSPLRRWSISRRLRGPTGAGSASTPSPATSCRSSGDSTVRGCWCGRARRSG